MFTPHHSILLSDPIQSIFIYIFSLYLETKHTHIHPSAITVSKDTKLNKKKLKRRKIF